MLICSILFLTFFQFSSNFMTKKSLGKKNDKNCDLEQEKSTTLTNLQP